MTGKEYLEQYRDNELEKQRIEDIIKEKRHSAYGLSGIAYDSDKVQSSGKNNTEERIHRYLILTERYIAALEEIERQQIDIEQTVSRIRNHTARQIIRYRYLSGLNIDMISCIIGYSEVHTRRMCADGLKEVENMIANDHK